MLVVALVAVLELAGAPPPAGPPPPTPVVESDRSVDPLAVMGLLLGIVGPLVAWGLADSKSKGRALAIETSLTVRLDKAEAELKVADGRVRLLETQQAATTPKLDHLTVTLEKKADNATVDAVGKNVDLLRADLVSRFSSLETMVATAIRDNTPKGGGRGRG